MSDLVINYPGVYVKEDTSLSLSVGSSATAVPVIFFKSTDLDSIHILTAVDSWLSFIKLYPTDKSVHYLTALEKSMRSYFDNGGGRCYIAPDENSSDKSYLDNLANAILGKGDVTLLVQAGTPSESFEKIVGQGSLNKIFVIYDGVPNVDKDSKFVGNPKLIYQGYARKDQGAVYYPGLKTTQYLPPDENGIPTVSYVSPSAAVAGVYCKTDSLRGVWKAPANVAIVGGLTPEFNITDAQQGVLNDAAGAVNVIRQFRNGDTLVWGARTLSSDVNWRYVPVRRLFNAIEVDIKTAMQPAMFEPNVPITWEKIRSAIDVYLHSLWQQGGLFGSKPEEAYFVKIGLNSTMSEEDINQGKMVVKVGVAAVRPAEFIILEFSQFVANS
ncbi:phage tail sheath family protein [Rouxiella sp. WC2420]|uniref:Phage tail sheath family protein n=1 Tax=Rouxiella sp. WC2420 TaxID=3234145 RepID=A0AB39VY05_9GAMM